MAGSNRFERAMKEMKMHNGKNLTIEELRREIRMKLSSKNPGVKEYMAMMEETGITKEIKPFVYLINAK